MQTYDPLTYLRMKEDFKEQHLTWQFVTIWNSIFQVKDMIIIDLQDLVI